MWLLLCLVARVLPSRPLVWKVGGPLPTQIHPAHPTCRLGMKRERLRNRYSIPPTTQPRPWPQCACRSLHLLTSTLLPRAHLTASVDSVSLALLRRIVCLPSHLYIPASSASRSRITPRQAPHPTCSPAETLIIATNYHHSSPATCTPAAHSRERPTPHTTLLSTSPP